MGEYFLSVGVPFTRSGVRLLHSVEEAKAERMGVRNSDVALDGPAAPASLRVKAWSCGSSVFGSVFNLELVRPFPLPLLALGFVWLLVREAILH